MMTYLKQILSAAVLTIMAQNAAADAAGHVPDKVVAVLDAFNTARLQSRVFSDGIPSYTHPARLRATAAAAGKDIAAFEQSVRQGYALSTQIIEMISSQLFIQDSKTGQTAHWHWALVPSLSQQRSKLKKQAFPASCIYIFAFWNETGIYLEPLFSDKTAQSLFQTFPEFSGIPVAAPECREPLG